MTRQSPDNTRVRRIFLTKPADYTVRETRPEQFEWLESRLLAFRKVFGSRLRALAEGAGDAAGS